MRIWENSTSGKRLLVSLSCEDPTQLHGSRHRTVQLEEILQRAGFVPRAAAPPDPASRLQTALSGLVSWWRYGVFRPVGVSSLRISGAAYRQFRRALYQWPTVDCFILEGTGYGMLQLVRVARRSGLTTITIPVNLESLVPYDTAFTHRLPLEQRLLQDVKLHREADMSLCISTEEEWLLRVFGCKASYLPYVPPAELRESLAQVRESRFGHRKSNEFLMLGSIVNEPTRKGFLNLYRMLQDLPDLQATIHVAGNGTEQLASLFDDPRFRVLGRVDDDLLDELRRRVDGLIIMQVPTSGTLTRVIDAMYAGIPVIGNQDAVKSYEKCPGIYAFRSPQELFQILQGALRSPEVPTEASGDERLIALLQHGASKSADAGDSMSKTVRVGTEQTALN